MGFEMLLGNRRIKENLQAGIQRNRFSHFYVISGPAGSGKRTLARLLAAAMVCKEAEKPCLRCSACRKVMADSHPDFITVMEEDRKAVPVKRVREIREDMFIRPNEADRKIYMFAQELGVEGQNALLKILEEPPSYGVFILLTDNIEKLLPTVRSRSTQLQMQALSEELLRARLKEEFPQADEQTVTAAVNSCGGYLGQALTLMKEGTSVTPQTQSFADSFANKNVIGLVNTLVPMEKWKREQLIEELERWYTVLQQSLVYRSGGQATWPAARQVGAQRGSGEIMQAIRCLQKTMEYAQGNVSPAAICGYLIWRLR